MSDHVMDKSNEDVLGTSLSGLASAPSTAVPLSTEASGTESGNMADHGCSSSYSNQNFEPSNSKSVSVIRPLKSLIGPLRAL